jgi:DNA primase
MIDRAQLDEIRARVKLADLIGRRVPLRRQGRELVGLCPFHNEKSPSFTVVEAKGFWHCFGCSAHGDAFAFLMRLDGLDFPAALEQLRAEAGLGPAPPDPDRARRDRERLARQQQAIAAREAERERRRRESALELWRRALPAAGTLAETYLAARGIDAAAIGGVPASLRFAAEVLHRETDQLLPAMIGGVQGPDGRVVAIHRTFLAPDGSGKAAVRAAKMMLGPAWGGAVRFARAGERLGAGEGIETSLSVLQGLRAAGDELPIWALLSLPNFAGAGLPERRPARHPWHPDKTLPSPIPDLARPAFMPPPGVREFTWFADGDGDPWTAERLLARAQARYAANGVRLRIARPPAGLDFNDVLRGAA